jgi:LDH2 family malate/lactate/ureidoglycolate dehydrogenase
METLVSLVRGSADGFAGRRVLLPGEHRWEEYETNRRQGVDLDAATRAALADLARGRGIPIPW